VEARSDFDVAKIDRSNLGNRGGKPNRTISSWFWRSFPQGFSSETRIRFMVVKGELIRGALGVATTLKPILKNFKYVRNEAVSLLGTRFGGLRVLAGPFLRLKAKENLAMRG